MDIDKRGFEIRKNLVPKNLLQAVLFELENSDNFAGIQGIRNAEKRFTSVSNIISCPSFVEAASNILQDEPQVIRTILFDKTPAKNWLVSWHQDKTVAVSSKFDLSGWGPWTLKDNTHHVQVPLEVLNNSITFRIHLDPADETNGCLRVLPFSHTLGILKQNEISDFVDENNVVSCEAEVGDTLIMRPHLLHSSSKGSRPGHRRVIHVELSSYELPPGICWA